jgi:manganese oxidase
MGNRRAFFSNLSSLAATAFARKTVLAAQQAAVPVPVQVTTPDVADLPFTMDNAVKVFHLIAEPVKQVIVPGRTFDLWGFNGAAPGPTIQATEGARVRIVFDTTFRSRPASTGTGLNSRSKWTVFPVSARSRSCQANGLS